jgi:hypothetical protein
VRRAAIALLVLLFLGSCSGGTRDLQIVPALTVCAQISTVNHVQITALGDFPPAASRTKEVSPPAQMQLSLPGDARALEVDGLGPSGLVAFGRTAPFSLADLLPRVSVNYGAPDTLCDAPDMNYARAGHQATLLQTGQVLISGGHDLDGNSVPKLERYAPFGDLSSTAPGFRVVDPNGMTQIDRRAALGHAVVVASSGEVYITGGVPSVGGAPLGPAYEGYSHHAADGTFLDSQVLGGGPRAFHSATLLADGTVLLLGGCQSFTGAGCEAVLATSELFSPATGKFIDGPPLLHARFGHQALLRGDGKVLVVGGGAPAELFDRSTGGSVLANLPGPAVILPTGGALSINDADAQLWLDGDGAVPLASLPSPREGHTLSLFDDGALLIAGGGGNGLDGSLIVYDPIAGPRGVTGSFTRRDHSATGLGDGAVLLAGGSDAGGATQHASLFLHNALGPYSNLPTLTFDDPTGQGTPLEPRRRDHLALVGGHVELTAGAASMDGRPAELALVSALAVGDFSLQLSVGADAGAALIAGWVSDAAYVFVTLSAGQPVSLSQVTPTGVTTVKGCSGATLGADELPPSPAPFIVDWRDGHFQVFSPARRLLECAPGNALAHGQVGVGALGGTARFDDLSLTR